MSTNETDVDDIEALTFLRTQATVVKNTEETDMDTIAAQIKSIEAAISDVKEDVDAIASHEPSLDTKRDAFEYYVTEHHREQRRRRCALRPGCARVPVEESSSKTPNEPVSCGTGQY